MNDAELATRFIRGLLTEEELREGMRPTEGEIIRARKDKVAQLRRECAGLTEDLEAALTEIEKPYGWD